MRAVSPLGEYYFHSLILFSKFSPRLSTQNPDGSWPDVDYTTGCAARRANWPAQVISTLCRSLSPINSSFYIQEHWNRISIMSAVWHGGLPGGDQYVKDATLHDAISLAMDWWFVRDFTNPACLDSGGTATCPCSDTETHLWNTNWFSNVSISLVLPSSGD